MLEIQGLTVRYGTRKALDRLALEVAEGELFGILGPNGAGKTTLFSVLSGQRKPDHGGATLAGLDVVHKRRKVQALLGIVPQTFSGYELLTAHENLMFFARLYGIRKPVAMRRARELLGMVSLQPRAHEPVSTFSGGMRHRLNIILGLIHDPKVVIMDEPTTGLDPLAREELWRIILDLQRRGKTILLTTHYMEEAEVLCDRVLILSQGKTKLLGDPKALGKRLDAVFHDCVTGDTPDGAGAQVTSARGAQGPQSPARVVTRVKEPSPHDEAVGGHDDPPEHTPSKGKGAH